MSLITNPVEKDFFKNLLMKQTNNWLDSNARKFYINCIEKSGYFKQQIVPKIEQEESTDLSEEDLYEQMKEFYKEQVQSNPTFCEICKSEKNQNGECKFCATYSQDIPIGFNESQQMTQRDVRGISFNRTFLGPLDDISFNTGNRLAEIQTWINMSKEEVELKKINDIISSALNVLNLSEQDNIRKMAVNMFWNISEYYNTNVLKLISNKGNLRTGYIILVIEYAIKYFGRTKSIEDIVRSVEGADLSMIPEARKNIKKIFSDSPDYSFVLLESEPVLMSSLCNLENKFPVSITSKIQQVKADLINNWVFSNPITNVELAACIYYVTSIPIDNGGILQEKSAFTIDSEKTKITYDFLKKYCGIMTTSVLKTKIRSIINFYEKNPLLKQRIIG
jgi:hypothetical protein